MLLDADELQAMGPVYARSPLAGDLKTSVDGELEALAKEPWSLEMDLDSPSRRLDR